MRFQILATFLSATLASAASVPTIAASVNSISHGILTPSNETLELSRAIATHMDLGTEAVQLEPVLLLCAQADCANLQKCFGYKFINQPKSTCVGLSPPFAYTSVAIINPDKTTIPVIVGVGRCPNYDSIPRYNTCYNLPSGGNSFAVFSGSTGP